MLLRALEGPYARVAFHYVHKPARARTAAGLRSKDRSATELRRAPELLQRAPELLQRAPEKSGELWSSPASSREPWGALENFGEL
eukprot:1874606-Alexandrium_andersonii.AAC.1